MASLTYSVPRSEIINLGQPCCGINLSNSTFAIVLASLFCPGYASNHEVYQSITVTM